VQDHLRSATASILSANAFEKSAESPPLSLVAAATCDGSNWSVCGSGCEELVSQHEAAISTPQFSSMFKLYVGCLSSVESFDLITRYGIKAIANCCNYPLNSDAMRRIRGIR
jgi:hypothetical protein